MIGPSIVGSWASKVLMTCFSMAMGLEIQIRAKFETKFGLINSDSICYGLAFRLMLLVIR